MKNLLSFKSCENRYPKSFSWSQSRCRSRNGNFLKVGAGAGAKTNSFGSTTLGVSQLQTTIFPLIYFSLYWSYLFLQTESKLLHFDIVSLLKTIIKNTVVLLILANFYFHHGCVVSKYFDSDAKRLSLSSARPP